MIKINLKKLSIIQKLKNFVFKAFPKEVDIKKKIKDKKEESKKLKKEGKTTDRDNVIIPERRIGALIEVEYFYRPVNQKNLDPFNPKLVHNLNKEKPITIRQVVDNYINDYIYLQKDKNEFIKEIKYRYNNQEEYFANLSEYKKFRLKTEEEFYRFNKNIFKLLFGSQKVKRDDNILLNKSQDTLKDFRKKMSNDAIDIMKQRDPSFDIEIFTKEIQHIFEEVYHAYTNHDLEYIEKICLNEAKAFFQGQIQEQEKKNAIPKHKHMFAINLPVLEQQMVEGDKQPFFVFSISFQELFCLVDKDDPDVIIEGDDTKRTFYDYLIYVTINPDADIISLGHDIAFIKVYQRNKFKQLLQLTLILILNYLCFKKRMKQ